MIGCNSQERKDRVAIREAVAEISKTPLPRKPEESKTHTIHTSKGALTISTCGGKRGLNGEIYTEGPARANGFFLIPRMEWVNDAKEAERLLIEDYEKGNCQQFKEIEIRPATNKPEAEQAGAEQPTTRPESKPEGSGKPQPEAEGRSQ